jgi:SAM-dependent methyltransferase
MCNEACLDFEKRSIRRQEVTGKSVLEVGSLDVNGSFRFLMEQFHPRNYVGVDICSGPGVDEVCPAERLVERFGAESFDIVVSTELLEHVADWRKAVSNLKAILKPGGTLLITTRSRGTEYHGWPYDFWRYELEDMRQIFSDFDIEVLEADPTAPGVFMKVRKRSPFMENDLSQIELLCILVGRRLRKAPAGVLWLLKAYEASAPLCRHIIPSSFRLRMKRAITRGGRAHRYFAL